MLRIGVGPVSGPRPSRCRLLDFLLRGQPVDATHLRHDVYELPIDGLVRDAVAGEHLEPADLVSQRRGLDPPPLEFEFGLAEPFLRSPASRASRSLTRVFSAWASSIW